MIEYIKKECGWGNRDDLSIDAIESDNRLINELTRKGINVVWDDFLTYETFKEYDFIVMNPPFSDGVDHLLKAIELIENQINPCRIYSILNKQTLVNAYSSKRQDLLRKLNRYQADIEYVKDAFVYAERKTDVEVVLIRVNISPMECSGESIYDRIPFKGVSSKSSSDLEKALSTYVKDNEVADKLNDVERYVLEYEEACRVTKNAYKAMEKRERFFSYLRKVNKGEDVLDDKLPIFTSINTSAKDLNKDLSRLRRGYWRLILDTDDFKEHLTSEGINQLNKRLSLAEEMEINITNVRMLMMAIGSNKTDMLIESIVSIFKRVTQHHMNQYSTNIHYYNGWKTNDAYRINKKIIIPISHSFDAWWDFSEDYERINRRVRDFINDLVKSFQLIDPSFDNEFEVISNQEFENDLLRFKMFMNGNIHVWFNDMSALNKLNYICGQHFNWIPSEEEVNENEEAKKFVVREFGSEVLGISLLTERQSVSA